eukprot:2840287-Rhodomonas_salina.2
MQSRWQKIVSAYATAGLVPPYQGQTLIKQGKVWQQSSAWDWSNMTEHRLDCAERIQSSL